MNRPDIGASALVLGLAVTASLATAYVILGAVHDVFRKHRAKVRAGVQRDLATIMFRGDQEAAEAARRLARGPRTVLFDILQRLAADLVGDADRRLRDLATSAGLSQPIRARLHSRSWRRRAQGAALASLLPEGDPSRVLLLRDPHPVVRARAAESLGYTDVEDHTELLIELFDDPSPSVRFAAQQALMKADAAIVPALKRYLEGPDRPGTVWALEIVAHFPDPRLVAVIQRHAQSGVAHHRAVATRALGPWLTDLSVLTDRLADEDAEVRATAATAAATAGADSLAAQIGRLLRDQSWRVRQAAGLALSAMGPAGSMTLRMHSEDADLYARDMAQQMLATIEARSDDLGHALSGAVAPVGSST